MYYENKKKKILMAIPNIKYNVVFHCPQSMSVLSPEKPFRTDIKNQ